MRKHITTLAFAAVMGFGVAQSAQRPKLVVGIVIDQMRYDYLYRFKDKFGPDGFKKLMGEGFVCRNTHYNYVPTYTGPGHASIYSGTSPSMHGIVGNDWYDRSLHDSIYCVEDKSVHTLGAEGDAGQMSPKNLLSTTITDELKLATNKKSKVIGIALKDRGAILPAGHMADAAYWFDSNSGSWISSTFYQKDLPQWVKDFNNRKGVEGYMKDTWSPLLNLEEYKESTADDKPYEGMLGFNEKRRTFPYEISKLKGSNYEILRYTPFGNTFTKDFAKEALWNEGLGKGNQTDFMTVSFSSTDYIGHTFGPNSMEIEDTYIRLDKDLADLINALEQQVGKENLLLFLTADHGAAHVPDYLKENKISGGVIQSRLLLDSLNRFLKPLFGPGIISCYINQQIYLNYPLLDQKHISAKEVQERIAAFLLRFEGVSGTIMSLTLRGSEFSKGINNMIYNGFNLKRSGDIIVMLEPGWFEGKLTGTTHGQPYSYDTHVPLIWYGGKIKKGETVSLVNIVDIAPTLAQLLYLEDPSATTGEPVLDLFR